MIKFTTELKKDGLTMYNESGTKSCDILNITMSEKDAEKVFDVKLKNRRYKITADNDNVEISFGELDNVFGWLERVTLFEFLERVGR